MLVQGQLVDNIGATLPFEAGRRCGNKGALLLNLLLCSAFILLLACIAFVLLVLKASKLSLGEMTK